LGREPLAELNGEQRLRAQAALRSQLFKPIEHALEEVEEAIRDLLRSDDPLVDEVATHLLRGGGKRVRAAVVLLCGSLSGELTAYRDTLIRVAAAVEMIHMATLIHDDIIDGAETRRGLPTVNTRWNDQIGVLSGDFLFARSFTALAQTGNNRIVQIMADVVSEMSVGEIKQLGQSFGPQTEEDYLQRIFRKTAYFISQSCRLGGVVSGLDAEAEQAVATYGHGIGMSFQIIDDILDFTGTEEEFGKPVGNDLRAGLYTLPVLYALDHARQKEELRELLSRRSLEDADIQWIRSVLEECGAISHAYERAAAYIEQAKAALANFQPSPAREALLALADFVQHRRY